jgi:hypothetical protein
MRSACRVPVDGNSMVTILPETREPWVWCRAGEKSSNGLERWETGPMAQVYGLSKSHDCGLIS